MVMKDRIIRETFLRLWQSLTRCSRNRRLLQVVRQILVEVEGFEES